MTEEYPAHVGKCQLPKSMDEDFICTCAHKGCNRRWRFNPNAEDWSEGKAWSEVTDG